MKLFQYVWDLCLVTGKKITIAFFHLVFITVFCTLPHELGHAVAANYFSYRVDYITISFVRSSDYWFSFNLFGYEIRLGRIPLIGGSTRYSGLSSKGVLIITSAGLIVNLLLSLFAWWAEKKAESKFWKKFFQLVKEYNILTIVYNFLAVLWSPRCDVRKIFSLLFGKKIT